MSFVAMREKKFTSKENSLCKDPGAEACMMWFRTSKEASVAGAQPEHGRR